MCCHRSVPRPQGAGPCDHLDQCDGNYGGDPLPAVAALNMTALTDESALIFMAVFMNPGIHHPG